MGKKSRIFKLLFVVVIENIAALRAELRRMVRIWRLPATLIALEQRCSLRLLAAAFSAELPLFTAPQLQVQPSSAGLSSGFLLPQLAQNLPVLVVPQLQVQLPSAGFGSGFLPPQLAQNLPVLVVPQLQVQASAAGAAAAGAAGAAGGGVGGCGCCG